MSRPRKWTKEIRNLLYQILMERFGPYHTWNNNNYPEGKRDEYLKFLDDFSNAMTSLYPDDPTSPKAVEQQFAWGVTDQETISGGHMTVFVQNISTAYESGFLRAKDLPKMILSEREKVN